jgi:transposase InsO family protein
MMSSEVSEGTNNGGRASGTAEQETPRRTPASPVLLDEVPVAFRHEIDPETWGRLTKYDRLSKPTDAQNIGHILYSVVIWERNRVQGRDLWYAFTQRFDEWTQDQWNGTTKSVQTYLRQFLLENGVQVQSKAGLPVATALRILATSEDYEPWTEAQIESFAKKNSTFSRNTLDPDFMDNITPDEPVDRFRRSFSTTPEPRGPSAPLARPAAAGTYPADPVRPITAAVPPAGPARPATAQQYLGPHYIPQPREHSVPPPVLPPQPQPAAQWAGAYGPAWVTSYPRDRRTPYPEPAEGPTPRQLENLTKMYTDNEMKYGGEMFDVLDQKLMIFQDCAERIGILQPYFAPALPIMLKGSALQFYYDHLCGPGIPRDFYSLIDRIKRHFETEESQQMYLNAWHTTTLASIIEEPANADKTKLQCLEILLSRLTKIQRALPMVGNNEIALRLQLINACYGIEECELCLYSPAPTYEGVISQLRSSISLRSGTRRTAQRFPTATTAKPDEQYWTDRKYNGNGREARYGRKQPRQASRAGPDKKCYVCGKPGCWSTTHTPEERRKAYDRFRNNPRTPDKGQRAYTQYLAWYEGVQSIEDAEDKALVQFFQSQEYNSASTRPDTSDDDEPYGSYFTTAARADGPTLASLLADASAWHQLIKEDPLQRQLQASSKEKDGPGDIFTLDSRYSAAVFHGIMPDSGAAGHSTAGRPQFQALQRQLPSISLNEAAQKATIKFGGGTPITSLGTTSVPTPLGEMEFHVIEADTPFLLCLQDMDRLGIKFDNLRNLLQQGDLTVPIVRRWGHPWMQLTPEKALTAFLTDTELRRLHRRFGHPSVARLHKVLTTAGHSVEISAVEFLHRVCHQCQMNAPSPARFKFTLRDDYEFNYEVMIDIMYLEGNLPVLHVVDTATAFNAAKFLKDISTRQVWDTLRLCWIDVYQGPPDWVVTDAGKQFRSAEFRQLAKEMTISLKEVPIEAHNSIGKVERYHAPLRRAYEILRAEDPLASRESALQAAVKAVNDTAGPNGLVPTLLVFGAYPRMTEDSPPSPSMRQRAMAIQKATEAVRKLHAARQVNEALAARNGPDTSQTTHLPLQAKVRVWREKGGWQGPYTLVGVEGESCTVATERGPQVFRSTVVKPYHEDPDGQEPLPAVQQSGEAPPDESLVPSVAPTTAADAPNPPKRGRGRPRKIPLITGTFEQGPFLPETTDADVFLTSKEQSDAALAVQLRAEGKITAPGDPFEESTKAEIESLIGRGVFQFVRLQDHARPGDRIFKSRIVNEVKGKTTTPYEKSRLVIQGYGDDGKTAILTQSPTIQRASQRLILAIVPTLLLDGMVAWLRDITQAYVQSGTELNRKILAQLPAQIRDLYPPDTVMRVIKPLYGIAEAGTHWWATYHNHHIKKLQMTTSSYDPCLLISTAENPDFACVGMQTDDTLGLSTATFSTREDEQLKEAKFTAKPKQVLTAGEPLIFNGGIVSLDGDSITLRQKGQAGNLALVDADAPTLKQQYVEQRARGAYIASICQPEACFDLSSAAQHQDPTKEDVKALNRRIQWQIDSQSRGLTFVPLDLATASLFVFVDGSFANNKDLTSQLGFTIILANEEAATKDHNEFSIRGNMVHFSSTKSKRVTRSVLASEVYGMVAGVDMAYALATTLHMITAHLGLPVVPTIVCTDSYSLYECLVKLGTTKEKRLMIDIMALRQSYERRELQEVRWIHGDDNLADAFTKAAPNRALEHFISSNTATIRVEGWVSR